MWVWLKSGAVLGLSMLLMGSKLIIHVPEGGAVVSSSGLFACAAGETCTIEIDEHAFAETFTAVPEAGYTFGSWGSGAGAVCRASRDAYCDELDTGPFSSREETASPIRPGTVLSMTPTFNSSGYAAQAPAPPFSVSSYQSTRYYPVRGANQQEVWAQLTGAANPLPVDRSAGTKPLGHAAFQYRYDYRSEYAGDSSSCRVASGTLEFRFETVLPRLASGANMSEQLRTRWSSLQDLVTEHEAGHHAIYRELVTRLPQLMQDVGEAPCSELAGRVSLAVTAAVDAVKQDSKDYDDLHGGETYTVSSL